MFFTCKAIKKRHFLLTEILISLTLISAFMPSILRDQCLYKREVEKLVFINEFENSFKELLFNLCYEIQNEEYLKAIESHKNESFTLHYKDLNIKNLDGDQKFATELILERYDKEGVHYQVSALINVLNLPYHVENLQKDPQHFWIKKTLLN